MKKIKYALIVFVFLLAGCKKNSVTLDEFIDQAKFNGYIVEENKTGYETYPNIIDVYYAINREDAYDIQFLKLDNIDYSKNFFLLNVDEIKKEVTSENYVKSMSLSNYEYYHMENESTYYLVIRSNENIIYITAPIGYISEIEEFLDDLDIDY